MLLLHVLFQFFSSEKKKTFWISHHAQMTSNYFDICNPEVFDMACRRNSKINVLKNQQGDPSKSTINVINEFCKWGSELQEFIL